MLEFCLAVLFLVITPGPGVLSTAGVGSGFGYRAGLAYVGGLFVGNNVVAGLVISGVAAVALAVPWLRSVLLFASTAYLLYLAGKIAFAGSRIAFIHSERAPGFWNGLALQPINPKAYVMNVTAFASFTAPGMAYGLQAVMTGVTLALVMVFCTTSWTLGGDVLRHWLTQARYAAVLRRGLAVAMVASVGVPMLLS